MTSSKSSTHFVPDPLWAPRDKAFAQKALEAEEAPFRPLGLAACIPAPREEGSEAEETAAPEVLEEAESPPLSEALEAMLEEAREEARRLSFLPSSSPPFAPRAAAVAAPLPRRDPMMIRPFPSS